MRGIAAVVVVVVAQAAVTLAQVGGWSILEHRTPTVEAVLRQFEADWLAAKSTIAPDVEASIEFPDAELYVEGKRALARTQWTGFEFLAEGDWRGLMQVSAELREHVAVHEVCHLLDAVRLRGQSLTGDERKRLELRAERCVVVYLASREAARQ